MSIQRAKSLVSRGYPRTRRYTRTSRELISTWIKKVGPIEKNIPPENVQALLNDIRLFPSSNVQVREMLECAKEVSDRRPHITEFYNFTSQIRRSHDRGNLHQLNKNGDQKKRRPRKMSKYVSPHDVFLGGSCNPTTWRHDVAIPLLESLNITYYNPQVSEWRAELVEVEHKAKESAKVLFFVLDKCTRNVVGIIEAAHFAGSRRPLVLVADNYTADQPVGGEAISHTEYEELCSGLATLRDLLELQGIPVFNNIPSAINWTSKILNEYKTIPQRNNLKNSLFSEDTIRIRKLREIFEDLEPNGRGEINLSDFYLAYQKQALLAKKHSLIDLRSHLSSSKDVNPEGVKINFDQFCSIVRDLKSTSKSRNGTNEKLSVCCKSRSRSRIIEDKRYDIYVGGSCLDLDWKNNIAIPLLNKSGLRYITADKEILNVSGATPNEASKMESSNLLLFVITSSSRSLETMALASYYIGARRNVILCIQRLHDSDLINGEKMSTSALSDYNRGRVYLRDMALRNGIEVYESVSETVQKAIEKCTSRGSSTL
ncbi:uncharacterized protein LOC106666357 isoform X1 [Cimex lectularius]|uniref:EF-hand domain-containing protein n=2 Tax=Cimex lectularius TaxID=79782 RepID=A0A8I6RPB2_CIMLE|nr:uncharacterized protein LOC106666357 isoform X1 [Cimex lectularius]XP_014248983.1 uncharacterized protein LOC106666357 isoform X1 [Cimex lectularius]XP_014248984.1 uncharacterized protein LOC106666357 isoform X1 [Cimex lectularius]XP_024085234.1 uncharacterized protein LOC106666357 isoform X1 [Cimex lectularius]